MQLTKLKDFDFHQFFHHCSHSVPGSYGTPLCIQLLILFLSSVTVPWSFFIFHNPSTLVSYFVRCPLIWVCEMFSQIWTEVMQSGQEPQKWCILRISFLAASDTDWSYYWRCWSWSLVRVVSTVFPSTATIELSLWWSWWAQNSWSSESLDCPGKHFLTVKASLLIPCKSIFIFVKRWDLIPRPSLPAILPVQCLAWSLTLVTWFWQRKWW